MQYVQSFNDFDFAVKMGVPVEELTEKFNLTLDELDQALAFYHDGNNLDLEKLLGSKAVAAEEVEAEAPVAFEISEPEKPDFGYLAVPRHSFIFVKPLPKEHKGRLMIPKAYESDSDMGFVESVGKDVADVKVGDLVLFDKYAEVGARFNLINREGELVDLIQMMEVNVTAILTRIKLGLPDLAWEEKEQAWTRPAEVEISEHMAKSELFRDGE